MPPLEVFSNRHTTRSKMRTNFFGRRDRQLRWIYGSGPFAPSRRAKGVSRARDARLKGSRHANVKNAPVARLDPVEQQLEADADAELYALCGHAFELGFRVGRVSGDAPVPVADIGEVSGAELDIRAESEHAERTREFPRQIAAELDAQRLSRDDGAVEDKIGLRRDATDAEPNQDIRMHSGGNERRREAVADADVEVGHLLEPVRGHDVVETADGVGYPDAAPFEVGGRRVAHSAALDEQIEVRAQPPPELATYRGV